MGCFYRACVSGRGQRLRRNRTRRANREDLHHTPVPNPHSGCPKLCAAAVWCRWSKETSTDGRRRLMLDSHTQPEPKARASVRTCGYGRVRRPSMRLQPRSRTQNATCGHTAVRFKCIPEVWDSRWRADSHRRSSQTIAIAVPLGRFVGDIMEDAPAQWYSNGCRGSRVGGHSVSDAAPPRRRSQTCTREIHLILRPDTRTERLYRAPTRPLATHLARVALTCDVVALHHAVDVACVHRHAPDSQPRRRARASRSHVL